LTQKTNKLTSLFKNKSVLFFKKMPGFNQSKKSKRGESVDRKLIFSLYQSALPNLKQFKYVGQFLSKKETRIIQVCLGIIAVNIVFLGAVFYKNNVKLVPAYGSSYTEALTGSPKLVNPLYALINNVDGDLAALIYSGLLKRGKDNNLAPDLAEKFEASDDGKTYTFYLKSGAAWHDKTPISADDVVFTFQAIANPEYRSPLRVSFTGVSVEKINEKTVKFSLAEPYAAFLELLTVGILPANIWSQISPAAANLADLNLKPIGSGPYKFKSLAKDKAGRVRSYELEANQNYFGQKPYVSVLVFKFFPSFEESVSALNEGKAEGLDYLPKEYEEKIVDKNKFNRNYLAQPQFTSLFFNQNNLGALKDLKIRQALAYGLDKKSITAALPHAQFIDSPILPIFTGFVNPDIIKYDFDPDKARALIAAAGFKATAVKEEPDNTATTSEKSLPGPGIWQKKDNDFLVVTLTTVNQPDAVQTAELVKKAWENLNIKVNLDVIPIESAQGDRIRPRNYQVLLYSVILGADPDQYPFWHSSQIGPSGLNFANYNNKEIDALLEDGRITGKTEVRREKYKKFQEIIARDLPTIFLYSQPYSYLQSNKIKGFDTDKIIIASDRFSNISNWYINTRKKIVW